MRRTLLTAVISVIALSGAITVLPAIAAPLFPPPSPKCRSLTGDRVVLRAPHVAVYRGTAPGLWGVHDWACTRPSASASPVGADPGTDRFPSGETIHLITAAGPWVAAFESAIGAFRGCPGPGVHCPSYHHQVELIQAGGGSSSSTAVGAQIKTIHISSIRRQTGAEVAAVVWLQHLHGRVGRLSSMVAVSRKDGGSGSVGMVAVGRIAPRSIRLVGLRVRFVENGKRRSVRLSAG